jgi:hypothetical protein
VQYLNSSDKAKLQSPELSSSPPMLANSSFTDYTDSGTGLTSTTECGSHFKLGIDRKAASPLQSEYSFYFSSAERHGFFRKAVPALPLCAAVLFCILNLVVPGSGTARDRLCVCLCLCVIKQSRPIDQLVTVNARHFFQCHDRGTERAHLERAQWHCTRAQ